MQQNLNILDNLLMLPLSEATALFLFWHTLLLIHAVTSHPAFTEKQIGKHLCPQKSLLQLLFSLCWTFDLVCEGVQGFHLNILHKAVVIFFVCIAFFFFGII